MHSHALHHGEIDTLTDQAISRLRAAGERITRARIEILFALASSSEHISADEVASQLAAARPARSVHRTTVYRTLERLVAVGVVVQQRLPGGATGYHLTAESHLHGHCVRCRAVVALPAEVLESISPGWERIRTSSGFDVDLHRSTLVGVCRNCQRAEGSRTR